MAGVGGPITVGAVAVDIVPSLQGFLAKLIKEAGPDVAAFAKGAGESIGDEVADGTSKGVDKGLDEGKRGATKKGADAGKKFSGGFAAAVKSGMAAVQASLGSISIKAQADVDTSEARAEIISLKREIKSFGKNDIDINLNAAGVLAEVATIKAAVKDLVHESDDLGEIGELRNAARGADQLVEKLQSATTQTGAFARKVDEFYKGVLNTLTDTDIDIPVHVDEDGEVDEATRRVGVLRDTVKRFRQDNATGLFDGNQIREQIDGIVSQLDKLKDVKLNDRLALEVREIAKATEAFVDDLSGAKKITPEVDTKPAKAELEGFARQIKQVAENAAKAITIRANLDDDEVYPELAKVKAALQDIVARIGVDLDDNAALIEIRRLRQQLAELEAKRTVNFGVGRDFTNTVDTLDKFTASLSKSDGKLEGFSARLQALASKAAGQISIRAELDDDEVYTRLAVVKASLRDIVAHIGVDLDDEEALRRILALRTEIDLLTRKRSINIGVDREVSQVAGTFKAAQSALSGASQAAEGFFSTFSKMTPAAQAANAAVLGFAVILPAAFLAATSAVAGFLGILSLVGGLAVVAAGGIGVLLLALAKVTEAIKERSDAEKQAAVTAAQAAQTAFSNAQAVASADQAVATAQKSLARARTAAARSATQAARSLVSAQRNLVQANVKETDARKALAAAYVDAKADLAALNQEIRKNRIEQEAANAALIKSREGLNALYGDPTASQSDIQAALADYHKQEQSVRDLATEQKKNADEKAKYDKDGLNANAGVIAAQAALKSSIESVKDAQDSVTAAAESSAQAQVDAANSVNDAEEALAQARTARANTLKSQQLAAAVTVATNDSKTTVFDSLTDKGKEFVLFYEKNIKPIFDELFRTAQDSGILSGIEGFFLAIKPIMEPLKGLIGIVGHQMGVFLIQIGNFLASDEGKKFIAFLGDIVEDLEPVLASLTKSGLSILFTLFEALAPVFAEMGPSIATMAQGFADMFGEFVKSDTFQEFLQNMIDDGPKLLTLIFSLAGALLNIINALAPAGDVILTIVNAIAGFIAAVPSDLLSLIIGLILIVIGLVVLAAGSIVSLIVGVVAVIVGIVVLIAKYWDRVPKVIRDGLHGILDDTVGVFATILDAIAGFFKWFADGWGKVFSDAADTLSSWGDNIAKFFSGFVDRIGKIWDGIVGFFEDPLVVVVGFINDYLIDPFNSVSKIVSGPQIDRIAAPAVKHAAYGTIIPGYQSSKRDEVPAMLRKGEGVLVPEVVRELGAGTIMDWNRRANLGQSIRHFAYGGLVDQIVAFERKSGIPFNVTSGVRNSNDYHGKGMAVDTASTAGNMQNLASWLYGFSPYLLELIHSGGPGYFVKGGKKVGSGYYKSVVAQHYNHVHTAMNQAGLLAVQEGADPAEGTTEEPTGLAATLLNRIKDRVKAGIEKVLGGLADSTLGKLTVSMTDTLIGKMGGFLIDKAGGLLDVGSSIVSGTTNFLKSLLGKDDESGKGTFDHSVGKNAAPQTASAYAKSLLPQFGWDSTDMENLAKLWNGESGWRWNATNPSSGAYGIPQSWPANKMASVGSDWATNAFTQVLWGMGYIKDQYKNPTDAYLTWLGRTPHWYDTGGYLPPGLTLAYNGTGRNERVMTHEQEQDMLRDRASMRGGADINVHVHDGKVSGLVTAEVDRQFGALADSYVYGGA